MGLPLPPLPPDDDMQQHPMPAHPKANSSPGVKVTGPKGGGWMNKMTAMVVAIQDRQWEKVKELANRFSQHHSLEGPIRTHRANMAKYGGYDPTMTWM